MRHKVAGRKLGRKTAHRKALLRNLATALFQHERIITTLPKAKELRRVVDKLITKGKSGSLHDRRQILAYVMSKDIAHKVMEEVAPRFADRNGGYTRIYKLGYRTGDMAEKALIELVGSELKVSEKKKGKRAKAEKKEKEDETQPSEAGPKEESEKDK
jgi:large subunit ribosomal protein L17